MVGVVLGRVGGELGPGGSGYWGRGGAWGGARVVGLQEGFDQLQQEWD